MQGRSNAVPKTAVFLQAMISVLSIALLISVMKWTYGAIDPRKQNDVVPPTVPDLAMTFIMFAIPILAPVLLIVRRRLGWILCIGLDGLLTAACAGLYIFTFISARRAGSDGADVIDRLAIYEVGFFLSSLTTYLLSRSSSRVQFTSSRKTSSEFSQEVGIQP